MSEHHSRLTRFFSKFTINSINHNKRKNSLPNLKNNQPTNNHPTQEQLNPASISLQPLLPLPTIIDRSSHSLSSSTNDNDGADPNASIRPITPSSRAISISDHTSHNPPSTSSSEEPLDDCKSTFANSSLASTKPTTVISLENGLTNRIAQPLTSPITTHHHHQSLIAQAHLRHHPRPNLHPSPNQPTTPTLTLHSSPPLSPQNQFSLVNVPRHSLPHPSQNPHPAALADNASILTLASSGFSPSLHHNQNFPSDENASVRALAPSRRESIESLSSRWSNVKSTRTGGSIRTTGTGFYTGIGSMSNCDSAGLSVEQALLTSPTGHEPTSNPTPLDILTPSNNLSDPSLLAAQSETTPTIELSNPSSSPITSTDEKAQLAQDLQVYPSPNLE